MLPHGDEPTDRPDVFEGGSIPGAERVGFESSSPTAWVPDAVVLDGGEAVPARASG